MKNIASPQSGMKRIFIFRLCFNEITADILAMAKYRQGHLTAIFRNKLIIKTMLLYPIVTFQ
ncbi:hypothetical protein FYL58_16320 [Klebsiella aerogenes]|nr:hypothetical protein [Klebsiella aerogenes]EIW9499116.1 hypothetical protein [Klebsiella aerogenes]KLF11017.1 hypothetical protein YA28_22810 [Klebsiella aerogenes]KLF74854.1 hypothetical protein YA38_01280 [Klebsiella aerogenes]KZR03415.1 hypothetical protein A3N63_19940 [Klebsiella aerogenes]